jgi:hypothetical protein
MVWVFFFVLIISFLTFASDKDVVRIQGRVMEVDLGNRMMIVNEKTFIWDQNTKFYNEKCTPITVDRLRAKTWVYIEGVRDTFKKRVIAGKIYLLPKHISEKEKNLYCFFNETKSIED